MKEELDGMGLDEVQRERALLCAYVLGELDADERAQVEARLESSAELRAEKARLEATLGLVSEALASGAGDKLPQAASATIASAAEKRPMPRPWYGASWVRVAAAAVLLAGGALYFQRSRTELELATARLEVAPTAADRLATPPGAPASPSPGAVTGEAFVALDTGGATWSGAPAGRPSGGAEKVKSLAFAPTPGGGGGGEARLQRRLELAPQAEPGLVAGLPELATSSKAVLHDEEAREALRDATSELAGLGYVFGGDLGDAEDLQRERFDAARGQGRALERLRDIERGCLRHPDESPRDMFFRYWGDNPFELTALDRLSTFSADVDTASYALARRYLAEGHLPTKEQVRTEEFVNYFRGDVPPPSEGTFRLQMELAPSLFGESSDTWMLRVALRGREVTKQERTPLALTFVIDVSGSMEEDGRLELVKHSLRMLATQLDANDTISIVKFSADAALVLPATSARHRDLIESALEPLAPEGGTNTEAGLRMGYAQAVAALTKGAQNRVVLLTDGVANIGITDPSALVALVEKSRREGVLLNTVGVGMDNHNDHLLEQLADKGDGVCNYVDDQREVRRALVDNFTGAFETIARDVKLQVEFDPRQVERYRLLGYENRAVADADFRDAKVDAGEVGAGHQVVALYELVRTGGGDGPLATARVRWKAPYKDGIADAESNAVEQELETRLGARDAVGGPAQASNGYRRSVLVAQFAEFLRRSVHARRDSLDTLLAESERLERDLRDDDFTQFVELVRRSREILLAELARRDWVDDCGDLIRYRHYLREQVDELRRRCGESDSPEREESSVRIDTLGGDFERTPEQASRELVERLMAENIALQRRVIDLAAKAAREGK